MQHKSPQSDRQIGEQNENSSFCTKKNLFFRLEKLLWASYPVER